LPNITYMDLEHPDGFTLDAMLRLPSNFDPSKKYPMLLIPYGGPNAKEVHKQFSAFNWKAYMPLTLSSSTSP
jgi:dipeptidyl-peptidase-4